MVRNKISISLILRKDKQRKDGKCPIYYLVLFNGKHIKIPTGKYVLEDDWDNSRKKVRNDVILNNNFRKNMADFDSFISKSEMAEYPLSQERIKDFFSGVDTNDFYAYYESFIKKKRKEFSDSTYDKYVTTLKILKEFSPTLTFGEINYGFVVKFHEFLLVDRENNGGENNRHKNFKTVIRDAINNSYNLEYPYGRFKLKHRVPETPFLTLNELKKLESLGFPPNKANLEEIRDMFLFSCFTGLRFSDVTTLKWEHIDYKAGMLKKKQVKTKNVVEVGFCLKAIAIAKKYEYRRSSSEYIFDAMSNQKTNLNVKKLAELAGIKKRLTYHVSRHTFGSILAENNMNLIIISKSMGHKGIKETQRYAKVGTQVLKDTVSVFDA